MSPLNWLNNLLLIENVLGIYRNYCTQKDMKKYLIKLQIFFQTVLHTMFIIFEVYLLVGRENDSLEKLIFASFGALTCVNSISSVASGIYFSRDFISYYKNVSGITEYLKVEKQHTNSLMKVVYVGLTFYIMFFVVVVYRISQAIIIFLSSHPITNLVPILISQVMIRCTVVFEHLMLFVVVMILVHFLRCLTLMISAVQKRMASNDISSVEQCYVTSEKIQEWVELYRDLANCCDRVSLCFGRQYFFSLVLSLSQYVFTTYQMVYMNAHNFRNNFDFARIAIIILSYISVIMMPLIAGQKARNQGVKFYQVSVRLYNTMIIDADEAEVKLLKDFIRLIKKNPIEIKLVLKIPLRVYILPVVLSLVVNYIIVILQFNHLI